MPNGCEGGKALCSVLQTDIKSLVGFSAAKRKSYCSCSDFLAFPQYYAEKPFCLFEFFFFDFFALSSAKKLFFLSGFFFSFSSSSPPGT